MKAIAKYLTAAVLLLTGIVGLAMSLCSGVMALGMLMEAARHLALQSLATLVMPLVFLALGAAILWKSWKALQKLFQEDR